MRIVYEREWQYSLLFLWEFLIGRTLCPCLYPFPSLRPQDSPRLGRKMHAAVVAWSGTHGCISIREEQVGQAEILAEVDDACKSNQSMHCIGNQESPIQLRRKIIACGSSLVTRRRRYPGLLPTPAQRRVFEAFQYLLFLVILPRLLNVQSSN